MARVQRRPSLPWHSRTQLPQPLHHVRSHVLPAITQNHANAPTSFGPNTFPANNSALFACETQVELRHQSPSSRPSSTTVRASIEVKQSARRPRDTESAQGAPQFCLCRRLQQLVHWRFRAECRQLAWLCFQLLDATYFPKWSSFEMDGGSRWWAVNAVKRWVRREKGGRIGGVAGGGCGGGEVWQFEGDEFGGS